MIEYLNVIASKSMESLSEAFKETAIKSIKDSPLQSSMEIIENTSLESLEAQNEFAAENINAEKVKQIEKNREDGSNREGLAYKELQNEYPESEGYKIEREQYLRDKEGKIIKDPETGEARRIDFIVTKNGQVVKSVEVTSETAPKDAQAAKESRIRDVGGNFIKDRDTGLLVEIPKDVQTEVRRYA
ncbi:MAG: hypothetical protein R3E93_07355 [Thiothrix sp.]